MFHAICDSYSPNSVINEFMFSRNKEIAWLQEEIKFLRCQNQKLLQIIAEK